MEIAFLTISYRVEYISNVESHEIFTFHDIYSDTLLHNAQKLFLNDSEVLLDVTGGCCIVSYTLRDFVHLFVIFLSVPSGQLCIILY